MPLDTLLMERFKVKTRAVENPLAVTSVEDTAKLILGNNPNRFGFVIINTGGEACAIALTDGVSLTEGIVLDAEGGSVSMAWDTEFQMVGWAWWVESNATGTTLYSLEVVEG